jgi:hypothetical protein
VQHVPPLQPRHRRDVSFRSQPSIHRLGRFHRRGDGLRNHVCRRPAPHACAFRHPSSDNLTVPFGATMLRRSLAQLGAAWRSLAQLGADQPTRFVRAESERALQLQVPRSVGTGRHQIGRPDPGGLRQLGMVQHGAGSSRPADGSRSTPRSTAWCATPRLGGCRSRSTQSHCAGALETGTRRRPPHLESTAETRSGSGETRSRQPCRRMRSMFVLNRRCSSLQK